MRLVWNGVMSASEELYHGDLGAIYDQVLTVE